jgi:tetratricopeptide (TPR) repeat protein
MTEPLRRSANCLDAETLAALVDGRLEATSRERAQAHLTTCAGCYEAFVEVGQLEQELESVTTNRDARSPGSWWKSRAVWYGALGAVAASVIGTIVLRPSGDSPEVRLNIAIHDLAAVTVKSRLTEGRLSGPFDWAPIPSASRATDQSLPVDLEVQARRLQVLAPTLPPTQREHALGLALLAQGDIDAAIQHLTLAVTVSDGDPRMLVDLSAALLERWRQKGNRNDAQNAKNRAEAAFAQNPANAEAAFNVALAAESLGLKDEAIKAWTRCAALYPTSKWAAEARARAQALAGKN